MSPADRKAIEEAARALNEREIIGDEHRRALGSFLRVFWADGGEMDAAITMLAQAAYAAGIAEGRAQARRQHAEDLLEQARSFE